MLPFDALADPEPASAPVLIVAVVVVVLVLLIGAVLYFRTRK